MSKTGLQKVTQESEEMTLDAIQQDHTQEALKNLHLGLGAIGGLRLSSKFNAVSTIKLMQQMRDNHAYKSLGYDNFKDWLEKDPDAKSYIGISYKTFNNLENQLNSEGEEIYELLNEFRIPISTRKLLTDGEIKIAVEGDTLQVGNETINLAEKPDVKQIFKDLAKDVRKITEEKAATEKKVETLTEQLKTGQQEFQELQRAMDAKLEGSSYEQALTRAIAALINLSVEANKLTLIETQSRGRGDVEAIWQQILLYRSAMQQDDFAFIEGTEGIKVVENKQLSKKVSKIFADADFGDENEQ